MKAVGCVAVVFVVAVAGFFGLAAFVMGRGEDQSGLTKRVDLTVTDPEESYDPTTGGGYTFDYAYEQGGRWYGGEREIRDNYWRPGQPLTACINPDQPREHVITIRLEPCGQEIIVGGMIKEAAPTAAPRVER